MSDQQIREWARGEGLDVPARGRVPGELRDRFAVAHPDADSGDNSGLSVVDLDALAEADGAGEAAPSRPVAAQDYPDNGERAPKPPEGTRLVGRGRPKVIRPKVVHRRVSLEDLAADGWSTMAALVGSQGLGPTARVLDLQAPVAGMILEDTLRGTLADRILQPLARSSEKAKEVAALIGPPLIVSVLTVRPELAPRLLPILRRQLRTWVLIAGPKMKARERAEKKALAAMGVDSSEALDAEIDGLIQGFFAPPEALAENVMSDAA